MTAPLSEAEVREALARAERATGGEWYLKGDGRQVYAERGMVSNCNGQWADDDDEAGLDADWERNKRDAAFIAHARTDVPRLAADLLAAREERDEARAELVSLKTQNEVAFPNCGICGGRGYVGSPPDNYDDCPGCLNRTRAERAEAEIDRMKEARTRAAAGWHAEVQKWKARCRELEGWIKQITDAKRGVFDSTADEVQSEVYTAIDEVEDAMFRSAAPPTPSHTCQIHRATSGASDCGLEPCEEAVVHRDLGTPSSEPAVEDMTRAEVQAELAARGIDVAPGVDRVLVALRAAHYADPRQCPNKVSRGGENVCGCPAPVEEDTMAHEDADPQILGIDVVLDPSCPIDTLTLVGTDKDGKPVNAGRIVGLRTAHPAPVEAKCATCHGLGEVNTLKPFQHSVPCPDCGGGA